MGRNAERLGLSKARYLVGLVNRDASEEEDRGPYMALAPEEQRELLEVVREVRALMLEAPPAREPDTAAASPEASPPVDAGERDRGIAAGQAPESAGVRGTPDAAEPGQPVQRQGRLL